MKNRIKPILLSILLISGSTVLLTLLGVIVRYTIQKSGLIETRIFSAASSDDFFFHSIMNGFIYNFIEIGWLFMLFSIGVFLLTKKSPSGDIKKIGIATFAYISIAALFIIFQYQEEFSQLFMESVCCAFPVAYTGVYLMKNGYKISLA